VVPGYEILGVLGHGGMGVVYKARQTGLHRLVALKMLLAGTQARPRDQARFRIEAEAVARVQHPNIVQIYDIGESEGRPYFALEFVEGGSLAARIRGTPQTAEAAARLVETLARAMHCAHQRGVVHRDLKPSNILLARTPKPAIQNPKPSPSSKSEGPQSAAPGVSDLDPFADCTPKITDFGLARLLDDPSAWTQTGEVVGTPSYMAPEQAEKKRPIGPATDVYALGAILYACLTGWPPFKAETPLETVMQVVHEEPVPPRRLRPRLPRDLQTICLKCLEKDPRKRYASALALADDLRRFLNGEAIQARPVGIAERGWKWAKRRPALTALLGLLVALGLWALASWYSAGTGRQPHAGTGGQPIRVGVLHSLSGTMISESASVDATLLAVEEINQHGGVLGRRIEPIVVDGKSDWPTFAREAERLITQEQVCTIFGCWTSASRKSVKPVVERYDHLLIYPMQYEGLEQSPNIVYTGATPNQQVTPAVEWAFRHLGKRRFFLVGSDYVWPRATHAIIQDEAKALGAEIVGEEYMLLASFDVAGIVAKIVRAQPDLILETIAGDSKVAFYRALRKAGVRPDRIPTISFSNPGQELQTVGARDMAGDYAAWNYFSTIDTPTNRAFVARFRARYGPQRPPTDPVEASYFGVYLWAQAVEAAGSDDVCVIRQTIKNQSFHAPEGAVRVDPETQHTWKTVRIGKITEDGRFAIVYCSEEPVRPIPYPASRSQAEWGAFLTELYQRWGGRWENPGG
jgi:urea transport system substrate-binding protein